jgi:serine protease
MWAADIGTNVSTVTIAVIDTGIARIGIGIDHDDLTGAFVDEYDFIKDTSISLDGDGPDNDATDPGDDPFGKDSSFHGTHVAGTIGALTNTTPAFGVAGVAGGNNNGVKIMPLRTLGAGGGTTFDIAQAVLYAAKLTNSTGALPAGNKAHIINMSIGGPNSNTLKSAITDAAAQDVLIVAAAGNSNTDSPLYPAAYPEVVSVAAVNIGADKAFYSNFGSASLGSKVDMAAPGGNLNLDLDFNNWEDGVLSTLFDETGNSFIHDCYQGTSMAAPHVAGVAALIKAANPSLTAAQIKNQLFSNAIDLGDAGPDIFYGYGLVNAYESVYNNTSSPPSKDPVLFPFPKTLKLEGANPSGTFVLENIGTASNITITGITQKDGVPWINSISYTGSDAGPSGSGLLVTVSIDTTNNPSITDGKTHNEMLEVSSSAGTEEVFVRYNVSGFPPPGAGIWDIGTIFVVALDPSNFDIVALTETTFGRGYGYNISGLGEGSYIIGASTDRDNDDIIFENGEAIGFFRDLFDIEVIFIDKGDDISNVDFRIFDEAM